MDGPILVAYATKHGSTEEVADAVAQVIRQLDQTADVRPAAKVKDVSSYEFIILGAPLYRGRLHKDALRFLTRHHAALANIPLAVFALGPRKPRSEGTWPRCREQLDQALGKHPWMTPTSVELFGGVDPPRKNRERRDQRDWAADSGASGAHG
jgi:menaquinone-dependent protoporphyrinogen oxidase